MRTRGLWSFGVVLSLVAGCGLSACSRDSCDDDVVTGSALRGLDTFARWTTRHDVRGVIGEVGWPVGPQWSATARRWGAAATATGMPVYVWGAAPWWGPKDPLAYYRSTPGGRHVSLASTQATDFEDLLRKGMTGGVGLAEGTFGAELEGSSPYSNAHPGVLGKDYTYPTSQTLAYLKGRGVTRVRLAVMWERLQPRLNGPLDPVEVGRVRATLRAANRHGMEVVVDLHNYGRYANAQKGKREVLVLGGPRLSAAHLADLWRRLAAALKNQPSVAALAIMNEPHDLPGGEQTWKQASLTVVRAIRTVDRNIPLWVGGYAWSSVAAFNGEPWIPKNLGPVIYEAHQYFDADRSGKYVGDYASAERALTAAGVVACTE